MVNGIYKVLKQKTCRKKINFYFLAFTVAREAVIYECCPTVYPFILFIIQIRRRTLYYVVNVVGK